MNKHLIVLTVVVTAYSANCPIQGTGDRTSTGRKASTTQGVAVDPKMIPLGSNVKIGNKWYIADDVGGDIKGRHIDLRLPSRGECLKFGRRTMKIYVDKRTNARNRK
jgi:3D (Asp-Asp-Asp) domain-containing protein